MNGPLRRIAGGMLAGFMVLLLAVTWTQVFAADTLKADVRNPRPALTERGKERGLIVSADGVVLARSVEDPARPQSFLRQYPEGEVFAHVVGYTGSLVGNAGLERTHGATLRSRRDLTFSDLISVILGRDLRPKGLELTIDATLQQAAHRALDGRRGAIVAIDPRTGQVLALVSSPSFDPSSLTGPDAAAVWQALLDDPAGPLRDRATRELYPPGSTFKTVIAATAVDTGFAGPETIFPDLDELELPGSTATISNAGNRVCNDGETVSLLQGFVRSCNTVFAALAMQIGADDIAITAEAMGFGADLDFPWSVPQAVFPVAALRDDDAALAQSGIGERDVRATPLHMAMVAATVANQGVAPVPYLVNRVFDADGVTVEETAPVVFGRAMAPATALVLTEMMERVVTEGTGTRAALPGVRVAGKTGTAAGPAGFPHAWFIGFAPVEQPTIALAVLLEGGPDTGETASGGSVAAPIAAELFRVWLQP